MKYKELLNHLVEQTELYLLRNNLKTMVLGISGGIDSSIVAVICNLVSKRNPEFTFLGVSLPSSTNAADEIEAANLVGNSFCDEFRHHYIGEDFKTIFRSFRGIEEQTPIANGNLKARIRMMYLYNLAGLRKGIVMDTDNLSEHYLGFWTIHGDEGDFNPIGDLWKHEIYSLVDWIIDEFPDLDKDQKDALSASRRLVPTDGNGVLPGGDMAQIAPGLTYEEVDEILLEAHKYGDDICFKNKAHLNGIRDILEPLYAKYGSDLVLKVLERFENSRFKRKHRPLVIRLNPDLVDNYIMKNRAS